MTGIRLQKILARAGLASRRQAEELIREGRVSVNGSQVRELGVRADASVDMIRVDGKQIRPAAPPRVFVLCKPRGVVTSLHDPENRPTVSQYLPSIGDRLYPVGRLDYHSEGLLLLTNDGDLAHQVMRAGSGVEKTYLVKVHGKPDAAALQRFSRGMILEGRRTRPAKAIFQRTTKERGTGNAWVQVTLHEGRKNQIRIMFHRLGHSVQKLRRVKVGPIKLGEMQPGQCRELLPDEIKALRRQVAGPRTTAKRSARPPRRLAGPGKPHSLNGNPSRGSASPDRLPEEHGPGPSRDAGATSRSRLGRPGCRSRSV